MSIADEISHLIKNRVVIRYPTTDEKKSGKASCIICLRNIILNNENLSLALGEEGLVCPICCKRYAPEMYDAFIRLRPEGNETESDGRQVTSLSEEELFDIAKEINTLTDRCNDLSRTLARGIIEAPAGHIGVMHYAKDLIRPSRKDQESDKDYEMRVKTYRMTRICEKIKEDTSGRIKKIKQYLRKIGLPDITD